MYRCELSHHAANTFNRSDVQNSVRDSTATYNKGSGKAQGGFNMKLDMEKIRAGTKVRFGLASILTAFKEKTVGTKVDTANSNDFFGFLGNEVEKFDFATQGMPGQGYIVCPPLMHTLVSAGIGRRDLNPNSYVIREHRGRVGLYLKRCYAANVTSLACVVYTREAYLADPDVRKDEKEFLAFAKSETTHVLVAVLASAGPKAPLTPERFLKNLGGGNNEAFAWTADEIRAKAKEIAEYDDAWCVVAD